ncbi:MAG: VOC family protein [Chitinophagaceae bacterium]|nr:VOC family protein [Chitinophagaceae bacterium]
MKRVTGIGGVFFKCEDAGEQKQWYEKHLGMQMNDWGGSIFWWRDADNPEKKGSTSWSAFKKESAYFEPSTKPFMFNYRVENLEELLKALKEEGVEIVGEMQVFEYGKFGWIMDPEGNKIELWEPIDEKL